ncbi:unnamed protein product, partial [Ectocarpus fasciculatus]
MSIRKFEDLYSTGDVLGEGAFSVVRSCTEKATGNQVATKIVQRTGVSAEDISDLRREVEILRTINSPYVTQCYDFFEDDAQFHVVLEYLAGGELFDRIVKKSVYNEGEARDLVCRLLMAVKSCHDQHVVHRDLKPENLLLKSHTDDIDVKLADFGFAVRVDTDKSLTTACGTPGYVAPEILRRDPYGRPSDMWSMGVITFIILGGYPPFYDESDKELFRKIKAGAYEFHTDYWKHISEDAKDLIRRMLVVNPDQRITVDEALSHAWMQRATEELTSRNLNDNLKALKSFNGKRKLRAAVKAVVAANRLASL